MLLHPIPPLTTLILKIPAIVIAFVFHEFAHAAMATAFGDPTPRRAGRLTLEPLAHLDWLGTFCLLLLGFGWAKPTPVQPANFKNRFWGEILVSSAGVLMNLVIAFLFAIAWLVLHHALALTRTTAMLLQAIDLVVGINLVLVVFNLLPIPPLDGWHVVRTLLPPRVRWTTGVQFERWGPMLMLVLIFFGLIGYLLNPPLRLLASGVYGGAQALVGLFF